MSVVLVSSCSFLIVRIAQVVMRRIRGNRPPKTADLIDLTECLAAALLAGERVEGALVRYQKSCPAGLRQMMRRINTRVNLGSPVAAAIDLEARHGRSEVLANIGCTVERSRWLGQPISPALQQLARELRSQHRAKEARKVSRVAPLAGLITALVIAPACVVALAVLAVGGALMNVGGQL